MEHPDGDGCGKHVVPHLLYLKKLIKEGRLLASGPLKGTTLRAGFLVMVGDSRKEVEAMVEADPFAIEGLICGLTIEEWDPLFGMRVDKATGTPPPELASLF